MANHERENRKLENTDLMKTADNAGQKVKDLLLRITEAIEYGPPAPPKEDKPEKNGHG